MLPTLIFLPALAASIATFDPTPSTAFDHGHAATHVDREPLLLAQAADVEVYFDGNGNRVIVDAYTGEVIAVEPPRRKLSREGQRRLMRQRELDREERYYLDDPEDMARLRRDEMRERGNFDYDSYPEERYSEQRVYAPDEFPEAPADVLGGAPEDAGSALPEKVERQPLGEQAITATEPETTGTVAAPSEDVITIAPSAEPPLNFTAREEVAAVQILMDRAGASPGVIDGKFGSNVDKAFAAYRVLTGTNLKSTDTAGIKAALEASGGDPFISYTITPEDAAGPFVASVPEDYSEKAKLESLSYTSVTEALAERFHMDENYLKALNPEANFSRPGTIIRVANVGQNVSAKVARITADKAQKQVLAYDAYDKLVAAYPATIGSADTPSPTGTHAISRIALDPNYTYNPKVNFKQGQNDKVLTIPPGPNGPVGSVWIALDKPTYGVHGTPEPSKIGKTESHGCVRLTNWDARELAKLVSPGVTVEFLE